MLLPAIPVPSCLRIKGRLVREIKKLTAITPSIRYKYGKNQLELSFRSNVSPFVIKILKNRMAPIEKKICLAKPNLLCPPVSMITDARNT